MRKNIIFMAMALICFATGMKAENVNVSVDDFKITQGETMEVTVRLTNDNADLTAFNMDLQLPQGLELVAVAPTERFQGEVIFGSPDTNVYRICGIGLNTETISGTEGDLITLTVKASDFFKGGEGVLTEIEFFTTERDRITVDETTFKIDYEKGSAAYLGDADLSGEIDVADVMIVVDYMLNKPVRSFSFVNADVNQDEVIDVADAMLIVYIILGKN